MISFNRRSFVTGIAAAAAAVQTAPLGAQTLDSVAVGNLSVVSDGPFFIAEKRGYFKEAGIEPKWTTFPASQQMIAPLAAGQLDVGGLAASAGIWNAIGRGVPMKVVADRGIDTPGYGTAPFLIRADLVKSGRYKRPADLKGLRIAEPGKGSSNVAMLRLYLQQHGMKYDDVEHVFLGFPDQVAAYRNGSIDASLVVEPYATLALKEGLVKTIARDDQFYPNHQISVLMYSGPFMQKRPDVAKRFMVAYIRGLRAYHDALKGGRFAGPAANEMVDVLQEHLKLPDPSVLRTMAPNSVNPDGYVNLKSLQFDYDQFEALGLITDKTSVRASIDTAYVDAAYKTLGPYKPAA